MDEEFREQIVSVDYMFMHDNQGEGEEKGMPSMVVEDRKTRIIRARVVPQKGNHAYGIKVLSGVIESLGHSKIILKSDQEPAMLSLKDAGSILGATNLVAVCPAMIARPVPDPALVATNVVPTVLTSAPIVVKSVVPRVVMV